VRVTELWSGVSLASALPSKIATDDAARSPALPRSPLAVDKDDLLMLTEGYPAMR